MFVLIGFSSCDKNDSPEPAVSTDRTIIVYMAADNDLSGDADVDLEEMKQGFTETGANLIVFLDPADEAPYLLKIAANEALRIKTYPEFNSADAIRMEQVLNEVIQMYPSEHYGLILWSHGASWLPAGRQLKSFVEDEGRQMNIPDLAAALPVRFDFILFDACLMGAVEVAYELKDKTDCIIASSTETIYEGFPYNRIIPELIRLQPDLIQVAKMYFDFYDQLSGAYRSATISVIDTKELENLAAVTKELLSGKIFDTGLFDRTAVQRLDTYAEQYTFDLLDFLDKAFPETDKSPLTQQLDKTVPYKAHTEEFIEQYAIDAYCGLSCYIPLAGRDDLNGYYQTLSWHAAGGFNLLFQ
jgi:hypothetical protein